MQIQGFSGQMTLILNQSKVNSSLNFVAETRRTVFELLKTIANTA